MGGACWPACRVPVGGRAAPTTAWPGGASSRVPAGGRAGSPETPWLYVMVRWGPCAEGCALWRAGRGSAAVRSPFLAAPLVGGPTAGQGLCSRRLGWWELRVQRMAVSGRWTAVLLRWARAPGSSRRRGWRRCRPAPLGAGACARGGLHRQDPAPSGWRRAQTWAFRPVRRAEPDSDRRHAQAQAGVACRPRPQAGARLRPAPCAG